MNFTLVAMIEQKIGNMDLMPSHMNPQQIMYNDFYNGGHPHHECPIMGTTVEQVDFVQRNKQNNNPYSNTYNPGWRNHPNFSLGNKGQ